jgi:hypothetical protein
MPDPTEPLKTLKLKRVSPTEDGMWGVILQENGNPLCVCAEIPHPFLLAGTYRCKLQRHYSGDGTSYPAYEITGVAGHTDVELHIANVPVPYLHKDGKTMEADLKGCVGYGMQFGIHWSGKPAVLYSSIAHKLFMKHLAGAPEFDLIVEDPHQ